MDLTIITLMVELRSELSAIDALVVAVFHSRQVPGSSTTPWIAAIGASGAVAAAIATIIGSHYKGKAEAASSRALEELRAQRQRELTREFERLKTNQSLQVEYDQDLRKRRIDSYIALWSYTMPLARYPEPGPLPYKRAGQLATTFRNWYFNGGGLFMSERTRNVYFAFQDALKIVAQKREGRWPFANIDMESPEDRTRLKHHLRPNEDWEVPEEVVRLANDTEIDASGDNVPHGAFDNLRLLGSALRTELAEDVRTREVSVLNISEQKTEGDGPVKDARTSPSETNSGFGRKTMRVLSIVVLFAVAIALLFFLDWFISPDTAQERQGLAAVCAISLGGVAAIFGLYLTRQTLLDTRKHEAARASEAALRACLEQLGDLLMDDKWSIADQDGDKDNTLRRLAKAEVLSVLGTLDGPRKRILVRFLYESDLLKKDTLKTDITGFSLHGANLDEADLSHLKLNDSMLSEVRLRGANLSSAELKGTDLSEADLRGANLEGAKVTQQQLEQVKYLEGATMPDGSKHP